MFVFPEPSHSNGSGYRTACGSSYLKPYLTTTCKCNVTVTLDESAVGFVETY